MIKAVFFDIDGTLVSFHTHRVSEATRQAIRQLRTQGIKVFIATGRHLQVINNLGDLEFDGYVTLNGSCCYIGRDRVIYRRMIPEIALEHLIKYQEEKETFPCILSGRRICLSTIIISIPGRYSGCWIFRNR